MQDNHSPSSSGASPSRTRISTPSRRATLTAALGPAAGKLALAVLGASTTLAQVGTNYCTPAPNSTSAPAAISGSGSAVVPLNNLVLRGTGLPLNAAAQFLCSRTQGFVTNPGGSAGNICLGNPIGRVVGGLILNSGATGVVNVLANITSLPQPSGAVAVQVGETWHFQCWFRDAASGGGSTSNFSDGLAVLFTATQPVLGIVPIPPGTFMMGSNVPNSAPYYNDTNQQPVHQVTISDWFWMGRHEVTQGEYQALMGSNPSTYLGALRPVENVDWYQAKAYCAALTAQQAGLGNLPAGYEYRLPTEAEWEYACRAGTTAEFHYGPDLFCNQARFDYSYHSSSSCNSGSGTVAVGSYAPNGFGLHDMHGNVWEWCLDSRTPYGSAPVTDPFVTGGSDRVLRGGSWNRYSSVCRSAYRGDADAGLTDHSIGFRVVLARPLTVPAIVPIPAGMFQMGSNAAGGPPYFNPSDTQPVHQVTISDSFWMGQHEVTQSEYQALMGSNPSTFVGGLRPVENVDWYQAKAYCTALTAQQAGLGNLPAGYEYRLPTEAEWEYACRAGTTTEFHYGPDLFCNQARFDYSYHSSSSCNSGSGTVAVGSYAPNAFGLYDMHGNVHEWCLDSYAPYDSAAVTDPFVTGGPLRVIRSGSWGDRSDGCRSTRRNAGVPGLSSFNIGFRVVLARPQTVPAMVPIPAGTFQMGSNAAGGPPYFNPTDTQPVHQVTISYSFWMGQHEVTQSEYQALMGANPSSFTGASLPVENVDWHQAKAYCTALTAQQAGLGNIPVGYEYRLPTEAEWEYACRAGTTTEFHYGPDLFCNQARFDYSYHSSSSCNSGSGTAAVGSYTPNAFGLYDMHGNLHEWCLDSYAPYNSAAVTDPFVTGGASRVIRSGSFVDRSDGCRSARRNSGVPGLMSGNIGFRVVLARPQTVPAMVPIPAGTFLMGSNATSGPPYNNGPAQQPVHQVTISYSFWMGQHEVTQAEYQALVGANPSYFPGATRPVEQVSWHQARAYCAALTAQQAGNIPVGYEYRLPTEAEWEYACRAGTTTEFHYGPDLFCNQARFWNSYHSNSSCGLTSTSGTAPVGSYVPNAFGLHDMHGNVWEWCLDSYWPYSSAAVTDPFVTGGPFRVLRGGGWSNGSSGCRSAFRSFDVPGGTRNSIGFRVVLAPALVP